MAKLLLSSRELQKTFVLQHGQSDCGVACLLSLVQYYGGSGSLEKFRELSGTTRQGTTLLGLYQVANQSGFDAEGCEADIPTLIEHGRPVILHVLVEDKLQHYIVCYAYNKEKRVFIIGDPGKGIEEYTREELEHIWKSKTCLTLVPNAGFIKESQVKMARKKWFLSLLKEDIPLLRFSIALGIGIAVLSMAMAVFSQKLIDDILPSKNTVKLITGILLVAFLLLVRTGFAALREYFLIRQSKDFNNRIIDRFFDALLHLPKPFFDTRKIGELVARLNDTQRVQKVIKTLSGNILIDVLIVLVSFGFLFFYSWQTGVISLLSLPFYFYLLYRFNSTIIRAQKEVMQGYAMSESNFITTMQGIATIKNNNKQSVFQKINYFIYGEFQDKTFHLGKINIQLSLISGIFGVIFLISVLAFNAIQVNKGTLLIGELMAILGISGNLLPSVANLALMTIPINEAKVAFNRMFEFASTPKEAEGHISIEGFSSLTIRNMSFRFAGRSPLLKRINLKIEKGKLTAVVGESGSGKSTLGQIMQKFYSVGKGEIYINNQYEFPEVTTNSWRNLIGVVSQEITIFNGTVLDNIALGSKDSPEEIYVFCKHYGFDKFIDRLPQKYTTIVGEEGINLSGGQKQIIALARALYKKPQLLILDEATSAMDRNTEKFTMQLLAHIKKDCAIFFITHRIHSLKSIADKIYVLENGEITSEGNHDQLMRSYNFYSEFWQEFVYS